MLSLLEHVYQFAEVYTVILVWVTVPLGFFALYFFYRRHYGMFVPPEMNEPAKGVSAHGPNT